MVLNAFYHLINKYSTIIIVTINFKLVTIRAFVRYNPSFSPLKIGTAMAVPEAPALFNYCNPRCEQLSPSSAEQEDLRHCMHGLIKKETNKE